jgi:GNAT superfamily N-acetyltransferase
MEPMPSMPEPAAVRAAAADEVDAVLACYEWLFEPPGQRPARWSPAWARVALLEAIGSDEATVLVAPGADGGIAGFCTAYLDLLSVRFGLRCWVEDLAVDPLLRSRGIGAALLAAAREWAAGRGASHLELDSAEARSDAHRFYEREGAAARSICFGWHELDAGPPRTEG